VCKHNFGLKNFAPRKIFQKKKKKKRKCTTLVEGKCDAIFFAEKMGVSFFTAIFFAKNPLGLDIVSAFS